MTLCGHLPVLLKPWWGFRATQGTRQGLVSQVVGWSPLQTCFICDSCLQPGPGDLRALPSPALLLPGDGITRSRIAAPNPREHQGNLAALPLRCIHLVSTRNLRSGGLAGAPQAGFGAGGLWGGWRGYYHLLSFSWRLPGALAAPDLLTHGTLVWVASWGTEGAQQHPSAPV